MATKRYADYLKENNNFTNHPYMAPPTTQAPYRLGLPEPTREYYPRKSTYVTNTPREATRTYFEGHASTTIRDIQRDIASA